MIDIYLDNHRVCRDSRTALKRMIPYYLRKSEFLTILHFPLEILFGRNSSQIVKRLWQNLLTCGLYGNIHLSSLIFVDITNCKLIEEISMNPEKTRNCSDQ